MRINGYGVHSKDVPKEAKSETAGMIRYFAALFYYPTLGFCKSSVLLFLLRIGGHELYLRVCIHTLNVFNIGITAATFFSNLLQCLPIKKTWDSAIPGRCIDTKVMWMVSAGITILTDILVLAIPIHIVIRLQMPIRVKLLLCVIFLLGAVYVP